MSDVKLDIKGLTNFHKALIASNTTIRVGIMGADASAAHPPKKNKDGSDSKSPPLTNAEVGAFHESKEGRSGKLPRRSFLEVPLIMNFEKKLQRSVVSRPEFIKKVIESGSFSSYFDVMEVVALAVVEDAFDTSGSGTWPASDMKRKKVHQTLVESGALRESIDTERVEGDG